MRKLYDLFPALGLAAAVLAASLLAVSVGDSRWTMLLAPLLMALALLAADLWQARRQGRPLRLSTGTLMLAVALVLACYIVGMDDPKQVQSLLPVLAAVSAASISLRSGARGRCGRIVSGT
jgi:peptidoglycan/LPS O-acetylase OafA/YrhL